MQMPVGYAEGQGFRGSLWLIVTGVNPRPLSWTCKEPADRAQLFSEGRSLLAVAGLALITMPRRAHWLGRPGLVGKRRAILDDGHCYYYGHLQIRPAGPSLALLLLTTE
jgi:hypothetical protein